MLHLITVLAAGVPNINPDYNNPATPLIDKVLSGFLAVLALVMAFVFFAGLTKAVTSIGSHHEGGARQGIYMAIGSAVLLAFLTLGTNVLNTWSGFFNP